MRKTSGTDHKAHNQVDPFWLWNPGRMSLAVQNLKLDTYFKNTSSSVLTDRLKLLIPSSNFLSSSSRSICSKHSDRSFRKVKVTSVPASVKIFDSFSWFCINSVVFSKLNRSVLISVRWYPIAARKNENKKGRSDVYLCDKLFNKCLLWSEGNSIGHWFADVNTFALTSVYFLQRWFTMDAGRQWISCRQRLVFFS